MSEHTQKFVKLVQTSSTLVNSLCKNIWLRQIPRDLSRNERICLYFNIPDGEKIPAVVLSAFHRQLVNLKKSAKVIEKIRQIENFVDKLDDELEKVNILEMKQESLSQLLHQAKVLGNCEAILPSLGSIRHRILPIKKSSDNPVNVQVTAIVSASFSLLNCHLEENEKYTLLNNSDPQTWMIQDKGGNIQNVPSLFLEVETASAEMLLLQRVKQRLVLYSQDLVMKTGKLFLKAGDHVTHQNTKLLKFTNNSDAERMNVISQFKRVMSFLDEIIEEDGAEFESQIFKEWVEVVESLNEILKSMNLPKQMRYYQGLLGEDEDSATVLRLSRASKFLNIIQILLNIQKESKKPVKEKQKLHHTRCLKAKQKRNNSNLQLLSGPQKSGTFRSVFEFEVEMVESVKEVRERIILPMRLGSCTSESSICSLDDCHTRLISSTTNTTSSIRGGVRRRIQIRGVLDTSESPPIHVSLSEAIKRGLIDYTRGAYVDKASGTEISIEQAMTDGKIQVDASQSKKLTDDKLNMGVITIRHIIKAEKPFLIRAVVHPETKKLINMDEALQLGILDTQYCLYRHQTKSSVQEEGNRQELQLRSAIERGLVLIEDDESSSEAPDIMTRDYSVHAVVDNRLRRLVPFGEALSLGLVDKETGAYIDPVNNERVYAAEAIRRALFKARPIEGEIDQAIPLKNRIVVETYDQLKNKSDVVKAFAKSTSDISK